MKRKTILAIWLVSFVIALIGSVMLGSSIFAASNNCSSTVYGGQNCSLPTSSPLTGIGLFGALIILIGVIVSLVAWVGALIRSASMRTWGWFVLVLLFGGLGTLVYALSGPADLLAPTTVTPSAPYQF